MLMQSERGVCLHQESGVCAKREWCVCTPKCVYLHIKVCLLAHPKGVFALKRVCVCIEKRCVCTQKKVRCVFALKKVQVQHLK